MARPVLVLAVLLACVTPAAAAGTRPAADVRPRVEHHVQEAERLADHLQAVLDGECPRFGTAAEWRAYVDGEVEQLISLVAHVEQAWVEAKATGDDDVRRAAKAPRRRFGEARQLFDKLQGCAPDGAQIEPGAVWQRVQEEVPRRQAEIALPAQ
jgi:hypothetical protein